MAANTPSILVDGIKHECGLRYDIIVAKPDVDVECHVEDYVGLIYAYFFTEETGSIRMRNFPSAFNNNTCMYTGALETHTVSLDPGITLVKCTTAQYSKYQYCDIAIIRGN